MNMAATAQSDTGPWQHEAQREREMSWSTATPIWQIGTAAVRIRSRYAEDAEMEKIYDKYSIEVVWLALALIQSVSFFHFPSTQDFPPTHTGSGGISNILN